MSKEIWVPTSEVKVKIDEYGNLKTYQEFVMKPKPIKQRMLGFNEASPPEPDSRLEREIKLS